MTVRAPAKLNLLLRVGDVRPDGFHDLLTVFHALTLFDEVTARPAEQLTVRLAGRTAGVPAGPDNLAARAAAAVAASARRSPAVELTIHKAIPVAAGLAGGSADAAAALVACDRLWGSALPAAELHDLAAQLGSDVAFTLAGGTAIGTGRGEQLQPLPPHPPLHWVLLAAPFGLATPDVYRELDRQRATAAVASAEPSTQASTDTSAAAGLRAALASGDPFRVAAELGNDLEPAAVSLAPVLADTLAAARAAGALAALVSGSGPTVAALAADADDARRLAARLAREHDGELVVARGAAPGAR